MFQGVQRRSGESGVVAEAVAVGDRGGERFVEGFGLHHLQTHPAQRQLASDLADEAPVCCARAHHDQVTVVCDSVIVDHRGACYGPRLGAGNEGVSAAGGHVFAHRGQRLPRFDSGVVRTVQPRQVSAAQRRVQRPNVRRVEQREAAAFGVGPCHDLFGDRELTGCSQQGDGSGGPESDSGDLGAELFPQFA